MPSNIPIKRKRPKAFFNMIPLPLLTTFHQLLYNMKIIMYRNVTCCEGKGQGELKLRIIDLQPVAPILQSRNTVKIVDTLFNSLALF